MSDVIDKSAVETAPPVESPQPAPPAEQPQKEKSSLWKKWKGMNRKRRRRIVRLFILLLILIGGAYGVKTYKLTHPLCAGTTPPPPPSSP